MDGQPHKTKIEVTHQMSQNLVNTHEVTFIVNGKVIGVFTDSSITKKARDALRELYLQPIPEEGKQ